MILMNKVNDMNITYTEEKKLTQEQVQALFLSVGWVSGEYPSRLYKALKHSSTVITAWDGEQLIGLVRVLITIRWMDLVCTLCAASAGIPWSWHHRKYD